MRRAFAIIGLAAAFMRLGVMPVQAHDIFTNLYSGGAPGVGQWCCSGDAVNGDCETIGDAYRITPNGDAIIHSSRYDRDVRVARDKITWLPVPGTDSPASWCGKPRTTFTNTERMETTTEQPDQDTITYCLFIAPGGV